MRFSAFDFSILVTHSVVQQLENWQMFHKYLENIDLTPQIVEYKGKFLMGS